MSFDAYERSAAGTPIELYRWMRGSDAYHYTSAQTAQSHLGEDFEPAVITRGAIAQGGSIERAAMHVRLPQDHAIPALFRAGVPADRVLLTIWRRHSTDPDAETIVIWQGRVRACVWEGAEATLTHEPIWTTLRRSGLRRTFGRTCPHVLGDDQCGVDLGEYEVSGTVAGINRLRLTIAAAAAYPDGYFAGGMLSTTVGAVNWRAMILRHKAKVLTIHMPLPGLTLGQSVHLTPGCDHTFNGAGGCIKRFANPLNHGGFPFTPWLSPHGGTRLY